MRINWNKEEQNIKDMIDNRISVVEIAIHYKVSVPQIYKVVAKIKKGPPSLPMTHHELYVSKKRMADVGHVAWTITEAQMMWPDTCPVLGEGVTLDYFNRMQNGTTPAITRRDMSLGYTPENTCVVSLRAVRLRDDGTANEHRQIANWLDGVTCITNWSSILPRATRAVAEGFPLQDIADHYGVTVEQLTEKLTETTQSVKNLT